MFTYVNDGNAPERLRKLYVYVNCKRKLKILRSNPGHAAAIGVAFSTSGLVIPKSETARAALAIASTFGHRLVDLVSRHIDDVGRAASLVVVVVLSWPGRVAVGSRRP